VAWAWDYRLAVPFFRPMEAGCGPRPMTARERAFTSPFRNIAKKKQSQRLRQSEDAVIAIVDDELAAVWSRADRRLGSTLASRVVADAPRSQGRYGSMPIRSFTAPRIPCHGTGPRRKSESAVFYGSALRCAGGPQCSPKPPERVAILYKCSSGSLLDHALSGKNPGVMVPRSQTVRPRHPPAVTGSTGIATTLGVVGLCQQQ